MNAWFAWAVVSLDSVWHVLGIGLKRALPSETHCVPSRRRLIFVALHLGYRHSGPWEPLAGKARSQVQKAAALAMMTFLRYRHAERPPAFSAV